MMKVMSSEKGSGCALTMIGVCVIAPGEPLWQRVRPALSYGQRLTKARVLNYAVIAQNGHLMGA